jgi:hypothetical protein
LFPQKWTNSNRVVNIQRITRLSIATTNRSLFFDRLQQRSKTHLCIKMRDPRSRERLGKRKELACWSLCRHAGSHPSFLRTGYDSTRAFGAVGSLLENIALKK